MSNAPDTRTNRTRSGNSLRDAFPGHFRPTLEEFDYLWEHAMFAIDTNVLLNFYRYSRSTRDELVAVLRALDDRLFLPHQVGKEFLERRLGTIRGQRKGFSDLRDHVTAVRSDIENRLRNVLRLRQGESFPEALMDALNEVPPDGYEVLAERLGELEESLPQASNAPEDDDAWAAIDRLFEGKVGAAYNDKRMRQSVEESDRRKTEKIPPGYKDQRPGDYVLWSQIVEEAKRVAKPVVLVTDDRKEDWWWIEGGTTIGPRPELIAEMRAEANVALHMYTPDRLMGEARTRLGVEVSDESINEAEDLGRQANEDRPRIWLDLSGYDVDASFRNWDSLTTIERNVLDLFVNHPDMDEIADTLGLDSGTVSELVAHALTKVGYEGLAHTVLHGRYVPPDDPLVRRNPARDELLARNEVASPESALITVRGNEENVTMFVRTLLLDFPEVQTVDRRPNRDDSGDVDIALRVRGSVSANHIARALEETAQITGVQIVSVIPRRFGPSR